MIPASVWVIGLLVGILIVLAVIADTLIRIEKKLIIRNCGGKND